MKFSHLIIRRGMTDFDWPMEAPGEVEVSMSGSVDVAYRESLWSFLKRDKKVIKAGTFAFMVLHMFAPPEITCRVVLDDRLEENEVFCMFTYKG